MMESALLILRVVFALAGLATIELLVAVILGARCLLEGRVLFHTLRQHGRLLLRVEATEARLTEAERSSMPLVSVVLPVSHRERHLRAAVGPFRRKQE
jgi:hypothetical protein